MAARADRCIGFENGAVLIDHVTDAIGEPCFGIAASAIGQANHTVSVTEKRKGEVVLVCERSILGNRVEADPQHLDIT